MNGGFGRASPQLLKKAFSFGPTLFGLLSVASPCRCSLQPGLSPLASMGQRPLFAINIANGSTKEISGPGVVSGFAVGKNQVVFAREDLSAPANLYATGLDGGAQPAVAP